MALLTCSTLPCNRWFLQTCMAYTSWLATKMAISREREREEIYYPNYTIGYEPQASIITMNNDAISILFSVTLIRV